MTFSGSSTNKTHRHDISEILLKVTLNTIEQTKTNKQKFDQPETRITCGGHVCCLLADRVEMSNLYRWPSVDASYQDSVHLVKRLQRRFSGNRPTKNKNCLWRPCLLTDRDEISILFNRLAFHRCFLSSFGSFGQAVSEKIFRNWPTRNKNCIWRPCLLTYRDEMRTSHRCFGSFR